VSIESETAMPWETDVHTAEARWQAEWEESRLFEVQAWDTTAPTYYCLVMFPYPSGRIHMGHVRNYVIGDVFASYHRMKGETVLHPIGWDAFGLPAENAAIKHGIHPERWTRDNIASMRTQLKRLGISYDWSREFATCDDAYYRWNQWFFLRMMERGLVERRKAPVNWCPKCCTVLANEQVQNGCWRCSSEVHQKELEQWFIRITAYADRLLDGHEALRAGWPAEVLAMQRNWIGRSEGAEINFTLRDGSGSLRVFTTRADTLYGATFMAIAPEHPWAVARAQRSADVAAYLRRAARKTAQDRSADREKTGVDTGVRAINPLTGAEIPIYVADYILPGYGTGAVMCVPAHDQRDFEFARTHGLPVVEVIRPDAGSSTLPDAAFESEGVMVNSGTFDGLTSAECRRLIVEELERRGTGKRTVNYRLKDWLVSRQRYWGTPIPVIYCDTCGVVPVRDEDLPVKLPSGVELTGKGDSPLAHVPEFVHTVCHRCGGPAHRETDTMDTFVDSSWYYARYTDPCNGNEPFSPAAARRWLPVSQYVGGIEHACMHLIYARFWHKVMKDVGLVDTEEPFLRLLTQGMVTLGGSAMSKSKGNIVEPDTIISRYGADTTRLFILFAAPPEKQLDWNDAGVEGCWRFINRVDRLADAVLTRPAKEAAPAQAHALLCVYHRCVRGVTRDVADEFQFNTAIAKLMELANTLQAYPAVGDEASRAVMRGLVLMLSLFTPHLCEELWRRLGGTGSVRVQPWPMPDPAYLTDTEVEVPVQINGKLRSRVTVPADAGEDTLKAAVLADERIKAHVNNRTVVRWVIVPGKMVNVVVREG